MLGLVFRRSVLCLATLLLLISLLASSLPAAAAATSAASSLSSSSITGVGSAPGSRGHHPELDLVAASDTAAPMAGPAALLWLADHLENLQVEQRSGGGNNRDAGRNVKWNEPAARSARAPSWHVVAGCALAGVVLITLWLRHIVYIQRTSRFLASLKLTAKDIASSIKNSWKADRTSASRKTVPPLFGTDLKPPLVSDRRSLASSTSGHSHPAVAAAVTPHLRPHQPPSRGSARSELAKAAERDEVSQSTLVSYPVAASPSPTPSPSPSPSPPSGRRKHRHSRNVSVPSPPSPSFREGHSPRQTAGVPPRPNLQAPAILKPVENIRPQSMPVVTTGGAAVILDSPAHRRAREPRDVRHSASTSRLRSDASGARNAPAVAPSTPNTRLKVPTTKMSHTRSYSNPGVFASVGERDAKPAPTSPESLIQSLLSNIPCTSLSPDTALSPASHPINLKTTGQHQQGHQPYTAETAKWTHGDKVAVRGSQLRNPTPSPPPSYEDVLNESRLLINAYDRHYHHHHPHSQPCDCRSRQRPPQWYSPFSTGLDFDMTTAVNNNSSGVKRRLSVGALSALSPSSGADGGLAPRAHAIEDRSVWEISLIRDRRTTAVSAARPTTPASMPMQPPPPPPPASPPHLVGGPPPGFRPFHHLQQQQQQRRLHQHQNALIAPTKGAPPSAAVAAAAAAGIGPREPIPRPQGFSLFDRRMSFVVGRSGGAR
ncbi:hypothetical protein HDU88_002926 [Geranomyces variabilis]|nr:hypothetical protein HDU88_002926 [Geranomyces variabilis]